MVTFPTCVRYLLNLIKSYKVEQVYYSHERDYNTLIVSPAEG